MVCWPGIRILSSSFYHGLIWIHPVGKYVWQDIILPSSQTLFGKSLLNENFWGFSCFWQLNSSLQCATREICTQLINFHPAQSSNARKSQKSLVSGWLLQHQRNSRLFNMFHVHCPWFATHWWFAHRTQYVHLHEGQVWTCTWNAEGF